MIRLLLAVLFSDVSLWSLGGLMVLVIAALVVSRFIRPFMPAWLAWLPNWTPIAIAVALAIFLSSAWLYRSGEAACERRVAAARIETALKDQATIAQLRRQLDRQQEDLDNANADLAAYEDDLKKRPAPACTLDRRDADAINR